MGSTNKMNWACVRCDKRMVLLRILHCGTRQWRIMVEWRGPLSRPSRLYVLTEWEGQRCIGELGTFTRLREAKQEAEGHALEFEIEDMRR